MAPVVYSPVFVQLVYVVINPAFNFSHNASFLAVTFQEVLPQKEWLFEHQEVLPLVVD